MKKFLIYFAVGITVTLSIIYLAFLFVLPNIVDLNQYIPEIQKLVKDEANVDLKINDIKLSTNPLLQIGIKTGIVQANLPDGSKILETTGIKARVSLPNLLFYTVKVSCLDIDNLKVNLDIANGEQYKFVRLIENILNKKKKEQKVSTVTSPINISKIKLVIPNAKITNYNISVNDIKTGHNLELRGDMLKGGYFNKKTAKLKTLAYIYTDNNKKITADLDLDSIIPQKKPKDLEDDIARKVEMHFVNPVLMYRNYNLQSNINAKLKIRKNEDNQYKVNGNFDAEDITLKLSDYQLPDSYVKLSFKNNKVDIDTDLNIAKGQKIRLFGLLGYGKNKSADITLDTDKIYFNNLIILSKALLDSIHIKNNLSHIKGEGYWTARTHIKTNLNKIISNGSIIARDGRISNDATNLVFDKINANLLLENNKLQIIHTNMYVNGGKFYARGVIDTDSTSNITLHSDKLPLPGLFTAFAPSDLKNSISMTSGSISTDAKVEGKLKSAIAHANLILDNVALTGKSFNIHNEKLVAGIVTNLKTIDGNLTNKNFQIAFPKTNSVIRDKNFIIKLNEQDLIFLPSNILVNNSTKIGVWGAIENYNKNPDLHINADGQLNAQDLKKFLGTAAEPFVDAKGNLPVKLQANGDNKKQNVILQVQSDSKNYITPIDIELMNGKPSILQAKMNYKNGKIHIKQTGLYADAQKFNNELEENLEGTKKIAEISGTIVKVNTDHPFINLLKFDIPNDLKAKFTAFEKSSLTLGGKAIVFGKLKSPVLRGNLKVSNISIPELLTYIEDANINLSGKNILLEIKNMLLNKSDIEISAKTDINPHDLFTISRLDINSKFIDVDKVLKVQEALDKYLPKGSGKKSDIPLEISSGSFKINNLKSGAMKAFNTTGKLSLYKNNLYINNFDTHTFDGVINGDIVVNLLSMVVDVRTKGKNINVKKALLDLANMKDTLTGVLGFNTNITFNGTTVEQILKNLKGNIDFTIDNGQLGPFGKIENMIMAENIRESKFFQTALGGVITKLATIDTSRFKTMEGNIKLNNGIAHIDRITTMGNVMSLHIAGDYNLLKNTTDMKVRAKLGSVIANLLGPLSQVNPINLVQATPGLNVAMAKTFFLFCETVTPEESAKLPPLETKLDDKMATKFQIVLKGDVSKPLKLIKSFKWLALSSDIERAKDFVNTLPDPSVTADPQNATLEDVMKAKSKEDAKLKNKIKRFIGKNN